LLEDIGSQKNLATIIIGSNHKLEY